MRSMSLLLVIMVYMDSMRKWSTRAAKAPTTAKQRTLNKKSYATTSPPYDPHAALICSILSSTSHLKDLLRTGGSIASLNISIDTLSQNPQKVCAKERQWCFLKERLKGKTDFEKACLALRAAAMESVEIRLILWEAFNFMEIYSDMRNEILRSTYDEQQDIFHDIPIEFGEIWENFASGMITAAPPTVRRRTIARPRTSTTTTTTTTTTTSTTTTTTRPRNVVFQVPNKAEEILKKLKYKNPARRRSSLTYYMLLGVIVLMFLLSMSILICGCVGVVRKKK